MITTENVSRTSTMGDFTRSVIAPEDMARVMSMLSKPYTLPKDAVIRELAANALDSHVAAGTTRPVEITLPTMDRSEVTVTDHGTGLSTDEMIGVFDNYGGSDKRDNEQAIGNFGIGSKSPYAAADQYTVRAIKDGVCTLALFSKDDNNSPGHQIISVTDTDEDNGVSVTVAVPVAGHTEWQEAAHRVLRWWEPDTFVVHQLDEPIVCYRDRIIPELTTDGVTAVAAPQQGRDRPDVDVLVRMGPVTYKVERNLISYDWYRVFNLNRNHTMADTAEGRVVVSALLIEAPIGAYKPVHSRETIDDTVAHRRNLDLALNQWQDLLLRKHRLAMRRAENTHDVITAWNRIPQPVKYLSYDIFQSVYKILVDKKLPTKTMIDNGFRYDGHRRWPLDGLTADSAASLLSRECRWIDIGEYDDRARRVIPAWRRTHHGCPVIVTSPEELAPLLDADRLAWTTVDELKADTPATPRTPRKAKEDIRLNVVKHYSPSRSQLVTEAMTVAEVQESVDGGRKLVVATSEDYRANLLPGWDQVTAILLGGRKRDKTIKMIDRPVITVDQAVDEHQAATLASIPVEDRQRIVDAARLGRASVERAARIVEGSDNYDPEVVEHLMPFAALAPFIGMYETAALPGMPRPSEFPPLTVEVLRMYGASPQLLKAVVDADVAAGH